MPDRDEGNLLAMLEAARRIRRYALEVSSAEEFYVNQLVFDATLMNFVVVGEMVDRLSPDLRARHSDVDWQRVKDMRNLVAHDYLGIDAEEVWQIIHTDVVQLESELITILQEVRGAKSAR